MPKVSALDVALNAIWAMEPSALETLLTIAAREHEVTPEALEAYRAKTLANAEQATVRDGVAILSVHGALIKRATFFSAISGASSYDILRRDLQAALDDPKVKGILLDIDSPGGEAQGTAELAAAIYAAREVKPIRAYVNGYGASAAYWIAAAVGPENIVIEPTAILGSIGVQIAMKDREDPKGTTTYRFVSSQSPMKNAHPGTKEGAEHIQSVVDAMASVFVEAVAGYRGVAVSTVLSSFGQGGIFVGTQAIAAGLADRIGSFETVLGELSTGTQSRSNALHTPTSNLSPALQAVVDRALATASVTTPSTPPAPLISPAQAQAPAPARAISRDAYIRQVAAGTPFPLPDGMMEQALASGMAEEAFALAAADYCADVRENFPGLAGVDLEAAILARRISESDRAPPTQFCADPDVEALALRIAGSQLDTDDSEEAALAARIAAA